MVEEARKIASTSEYSDMKSRSKPGSLLGRKFIMNQCHARGGLHARLWGVISGADAELKEAISGYLEAETVNADESAIVLNFQGKKAFSPQLFFIP